jgi:NADPH2:quinone reductase
MKAIAINKFGKASDVFEDIELPTPVPAAGEILVRVLATSVNPIDYKIRAGYLPHLVGALPAVLHGDVAGIVEKIGSKVQDFQIGDHVYGCIGGVLDMDGALAEYIKADSILFAKMPTNLNFAQAAALPLVGITAYELVFEKVNMKDQKVFIYGGTGGVGHLAIQFAKYAGAEVFAAVSGTEQGETAIRLGADHVINYHEQDTHAILEKYTAGKGFDIIIDTVGNDNLLNSFKLGKIGGSIVTTLALKELNISLLHEKAMNLHVVYMIIPLLLNDHVGKEKHGQILDHITSMVEKGIITPLVSRTFEFEELSQAHEFAEFAKPLGKVTISRALN